MAYSKFKTTELIEKELGIGFNYKTLLFKEVEKVEYSEWLRTKLIYNSHAYSKNEKSNSELIVSPILTEVKRQSKSFVTFFFNHYLDIDNELNGKCDFVMAKNIKNHIKNTIFQITEVIENNNFKLGIPQCAAKMYAAQLFNKKNNKSVDCIYGCVTTGTIWQFMKLSDKKIFIDRKIYYIYERNDLLGAFQTFINTFR